MRKATIGSVSSGTIRSQDLFSSFVWELEYLEGREYTHEDLDMPEDAFECENDPWWNTESASWLIEELFDKLERHSPPYCYFGACEGDGADYGFWVAWDSLEESVVKVDELPDGPFHPDETPDETHLALQVNDHGNATLYSWDIADQAWTEEWSMV